MAKKEYAIKRKKYLIITALIMLLFVVFLSVFKLSYNMMNQSKDTNTISIEKLMNKESSLKLDVKDNEKEMPFCIYVADEMDEKRIVYEQAFIDLKLPYVICNSLDEITGELLKNAKVILIGDNLEKIGNLEKIKAFLSYEISIVFTTMPDSTFIMEHSLDEMMGIRKIEGIEKQKGVRLMEGFLLGGRVDLEEYEYTALLVKLMNTCKIYMCALPEEGNPLKIKNEQLNPLIWRNVYEERKIFTINGPFLIESNVTGFLTAIFSEIQEDYLYPVINEIVFAINNFPYYSNVNSKELEDFYSRDAQLLQRDILWPDIIGLGKKDDLEITYYSVDSFTNPLTQSIEDIKIQKEFYDKSLKRSGGYLHSMEASTTFEQEVYAPIALDGFYLNDQQKMTYYSAFTGFGAIICRIDMKEIVFPKNSHYDWVKASKNMKEYIGYYINQNRVLSSRNTAEAAIAARAYKVCNPRIDYGMNKINVSTGDTEISYSFILRTDKTVKEVEFGSMKRMEKGVYLITVTSSEAVIYLEENKRKTYEESNPFKGLEELW